MKRDPYINKTIFSEYLIQKKIGKGSFGTVYQGIIISTKQKIAVKLEKREKKDSGLLEAEACRLYLMQGEGIPKIVCYGNNKTHNILIQELLGKSLEEIFNMCKRKFTLKTVCSIGIEMIKRIKFVHSKYHIHRDIKPDNFMTGYDDNDNKIYIIDFGLAKKYYSSTKKHHIRFRTGKNLIGTARYCGRNAHRGFEQGRRDDIESIGYVLMYFLNGVLPWQGIKILKNEDHFQKIAEKKYNTTFEELTRGNPEEFLLYFKHCDSLEFEDEPDYDYLINLFQTMINKYCNDCLYIYDWKKNEIHDSPGTKEKDDKNNNKSNNNGKDNKDVSLLVHNNVSAIESKGEGKEEDKDNNLMKKIKKDIYVGEDKNNNHSNDNYNNNNIDDDYKFKKLKKNQTMLNYFKNNLELDNKMLDFNENNKNMNNINTTREGKGKKNSIFFLNNPMTPQVQNINININFNNNLKKNGTKDKLFNNKGGINISENLFNDLYNKEKEENKKINQNKYNEMNMFNRNDIKKDFLLSIDEKIDELVNSHRNSNTDRKKIKNEKNSGKISRFQKPAKLESIFTEEDVRLEELNDTTEIDLEKIQKLNNARKKGKTENKAQLNNIIKNNNLNNIDKIKKNNYYPSKEQHVQKMSIPSHSYNIDNNNSFQNKNNNSKLNNNYYEKEQWPNYNNNHNNNRNISDKNNNNKAREKNKNKNKNRSVEKINNIKNTNDYNYDNSNNNNINNNDEERKNIFDEENSEKKKKRGRVKSVDDKVKKKEPGCCVIF